MLRPHIAAKQHFRIEGEMDHHRQYGKNRIREILHYVPPLYCAAVFHDSRKTLDKNILAFYSQYCKEADTVNHICTLKGFGPDCERPCCLMRVNSIA